MQGKPIPSVSPPSACRPAPFPPMPPTISTSPTGGPGWTPPPTSRRGARRGITWFSVSPSCPAWAPWPRGPPAPTTSTSPSSGRTSSPTTRPTPSCAWGGSSTATGSGGRWPHPPTPPTSWPSGARSSPPCGPCPVRSSSSCWNPNGPSPTSYSPDQAYPGNAYVDYVGTDVYDNFWGTPFTSAASWVHQLNQQWGLDWLGCLRRRAQRAHRHPRVVRRVPHRRARPG